jgi:hypothetical protein
MLLARRQVDAQHDAAIGDQQMHLGAETAARVAQRMFRRLFELRWRCSAEDRDLLWFFFPPRPPRDWRG